MKGFGKTTDDNGFKLLEVVCGIEGLEEGIVGFFLTVLRCVIHQFQTRVCCLPDAGMMAWMMWVAAAR